MTGASSFRFFYLVSFGFVVCILTANVTCAKLVQLGPIVLAGGTLFFPLTYIFGDMLTEVYGYSATRRAIWLGFIALLAFTLGAMLIQYAPAPAFWQNQEAYDKILGVLWRTNLAGLVAYFCGEFFNSFVLAKLKLRSAKKGPDSTGFHNRGMAFRFIASTALGQFVDSALFVTLAFAGTVPYEVLLTMFLSSWGVKVVWEIIALPLTIPIVRWLKRKEGVDALDRDETFDPFRVTF